MIVTSNPAGRSPCAVTYWLISAVIAAHTGVASEVPPDLSHRPWIRIAGPGLRRGVRGHGGAGNTTEGPPVEPCESSGSVQAVSPRYRPAGVSASALGESRA